MPDNQSKRKQAIESLLAERKKYEAWLTQLDTRRASTAAHVFSRVQADYTKRLDDVRERLGAEAGGIQSLVSELERRLSTEQRLVTEKSDERSELELRATVGEFSEKEWNVTRAKLDSAIAEIREAFDTSERELVELREILRDVSAAPAPARASAATPMDVAEVAAATEAAAAAEAAPVRASAAARVVVELAKDFDRFLTTALAAEQEAMEDRVALQCLQRYGSLVKPWSAETAASYRGAAASGPASAASR